MGGREAAHDDSLLAIEGLQPLGIRLASISLPEPGGTIAHEDVLSKNVGLVDVYPMPGSAVHHRNGAGGDTKGHLARHSLMGLVVLELLGSMTAWHVDEIGHPRVG